MMGNRTSKSTDDYTTHCAEHIFSGGGLGLILAMRGRHPMSEFLKAVHAKGFKLVVCEDLLESSARQPLAFLVLGWNKNADQVWLKMYGPLACHVGMELYAM